MEDKIIKDIETALNSLQKDEKQIKKYQMLVLQILKEINFNVNISLILDRFVLEGSD